MTVRVRFADVWVQNPKPFFFFFFFFVATILLATLWDALRESCINYYIFHFDLVVDFTDVNLLSQVSEKLHFYVSVCPLVMDTEVYICMCGWPCCWHLALKKKKKKIKEKKRQRKKLWSFAPSDFSPTRIEEALKTWDCVLWVNRGKEISVMWAFVLLTHKSVTTSLFLVIPPPLCLDQVSWASHSLGGSFKGLSEKYHLSQQQSLDAK